MFFKLNVVKCTNIYIENCVLININNYKTKFARFLGNMIFRDKTNVRTNCDEANVQISLN